MLQNVENFASHFFVLGDPMIYGADVSIVLASAAIVFVLTYYKKWGYLWREWLTTVDHKKIGIMYMIATLLMLFRGGVDAMLMRTQLIMPGMPFLKAQHYNEIFTTHGTIMILFMAMPGVFALMNIAVPLQIGARDVAFPYLNAISFWMFFLLRCCSTCRSSLADHQMLVGPAMLHLQGSLLIKVRGKTFIYWLLKLPV